MHTQTKEHRLMAKQNLQTLQIQNQFEFHFRKYDRNEWIIKSSFPLILLKNLKHQQRKIISAQVLEKLAKCPF